MPSNDGESDTPTAWGWWRQWNPAAFSPLNGSPAPQTLNQPILPAWTFGNIIAVTEQNSRAPEIERAIVAEESYGRQLGQVIDALAALIQERPETAPERPDLDQLIHLRDKIERVKKETIVSRVDRLELDLLQLKEESPESLRRLTHLLKTLEC